eukprot:SAG22_NODE_4293_length_1315_cov_1.377467_2_plen_120_part_00
MTPCMEWHGMAWHDAGHIEKRVRITPIRPMRHFFYKRGDRIFLWWLIMGSALYLYELWKMLFSEGVKGYFVHSQDSSWNRFEWCVPSVALRCPIGTARLLDCPHPGTPAPPVPCLALLN